MASILYEPSSIRADYGVLYLTEGEACSLPFIFSIQNKDAQGNPVEYTIRDDDVVSFIFKDKSFSAQIIIEKCVTNIKNNVCVLTLDEMDMHKLAGDKRYVMSATLIRNNKPSRVLIKKLPIFIQGVV